MSKLIRRSARVTDEQAGGNASDYREYRPPLPLAEHFLCFWRQTVSSQAEFPQRVLPDCCVDIIFIDETAVVVGPWTQFFVAHLPPDTNIVGARCYPGHVPNVLGIPVSELLNQSVPLRDVWGRTETARFARIAQEPTLSARMSAMETALIGHMADAGERDMATSAAIRWLARNPHGRVEERSRWLGFSSRQIQRRFTMAVGYGPKLFQSVLRFQRLQNLAAHPTALRETILRRQRNRRPEVIRPSPDAGVPSIWTETQGVTVQSSDSALSSPSYPFPRHQYRQSLWRE
jgi:hypothetical protein